MFKDARVGDRVWDFTKGWGVITEFTPKAPFPLTVYFEDADTNDEYTIEGKLYDSDVNPSLFWQEVVFTAPSQPKRMVEWEGDVYLYNNLGDNYKIIGNHIPGAQKVNLKMSLPEDVKPPFESMKLV